MLFTFQCTQYLHKFYVLVQKSYDTTVKKMQFMISHSHLSYQDPCSIVAHLLPSRELFLQSFPSSFPSVKLQQVKICINKHLPIAPLHTHENISSLNIFLSVSFCHISEFVYIPDLEESFYLYQKPYKYLLSTKGQGQALYIPLEQLIRMLL